MPTFYLRARVGGETVVKVEAPDLDAALEATETQVADDFNGAGIVRPSDVLIDVAEETEAFDMSLTVERDVDGGHIVIDHAPDDPSFEEVP